jgi:hypothetical protein
MDNEAFKAKYPKLAKQLECNHELMKRWQAIAERIRGAVERFCLDERQKAKLRRFGRFCDRLHPDDWQILKDCYPEKIGKYMLAVGRKAVRNNPKNPPRLVVIKCGIGGTGYCVPHDTKISILLQVLEDELHFDALKLPPWRYNAPGAKALARPRWLRRLPMCTGRAFDALWIYCKNKKTGGKPDPIIKESPCKSRR